MENLTIFKHNLITLEPERNRRICDCSRRSAEDESNKEIFDDRRKTKSIQTVILPLASIGGKSGINDALAVLRKIDGVTGATLFFQQTAVCIHYDPNRTDPNIISTILRSRGLGFNNEPIYQDMHFESVVSI